MGWRVTDITTTVAWMVSARVTFARYDGGRSGAGAAGGRRLALVKRCAGLTDPDGNNRSLSEFVGR